jgi:hypothetical protein
MYRASLVDRRLEPRHGKNINNKNELKFERDGLTPFLEKG